MNQNHALSACPAPTTRLEVLTTCSSGPARRCQFDCPTQLTLIFISCQLSFVFHDKDQKCKFAKNTVRTNRFSNLMFRLWSKLLCRWLASATHTWASNFPGCQRWWPLVMDDECYDLDDDPMTFDEHNTPTRTWASNNSRLWQMMTFDDGWGSHHLNEYHDEHDDHNTPTRTWASYFPGPLLMDDEYYDDQWQWCWPKKMNPWYFQRWDFASHNIYWAFLSSSMQQTKRVSLGGSVSSSANVWYFQVPWVVSEQRSLRKP